MVDGSLASTVKEARVRKITAMGLKTMCELGKDLSKEEVKLIAKTLFDSWEKMTVCSVVTTNMCTKEPSEEGSVTDYAVRPG